MSFFLSVIGLDKETEYRRVVFPFPCLPTSLFTAVTSHSKSVEYQTVRLKQREISFEHETFLVGRHPKLDAKAGHAWRLSTSPGTGRHFEFGTTFVSEFRLLRQW